MHKIPYRYEKCSLFQCFLYIVMFHLNKSKIHLFLQQLFKRITASSPFSALHWLPLELVIDIRKINEKLLFIFKDWENLYWHLKIPLLQCLKFQSHWGEFICNAILVRTFLIFNLLYILFLYVFKSRHLFKFGQKSKFFK
jgi:hypothetical protein